MQTWMVRAGRSGRFFEEFRDQSIVGLGWASVGDLSKVRSCEEVVTLVRDALPSAPQQTVAIAAGQLFRFAKEFQIGDRVVTYDPRARRYLCGKVVGQYEYQPDQEVEEFLNIRSVEWKREVSRDSLSEPARFSLGSIMTLFRIPDGVAAELWGDIGKAASSPTIAEVEDLATEISAGTPSDQIIVAANEAVKDKISGIRWDQMQELVAGLLRAMGYKTVVSPAGSDRGKDILASPDGFGLEEPRIVVEVKHRPNQRMGSVEIRSFLGGRHPRDRGLYVSTGGFTKEAYYEAERASIPLALLDFEGLVDAITEHYEKLDEVTKQIVPLKRIYWPLST